MAPMIGCLMDAINYEDVELLSLLQKGFSYAGPLSAGGVSVHQKPAKPLGYDTLDQLRSNRQSKNLKTLAKLKTSDYDDDLLTATLEDVEFGAMNEPICASLLDLSEVTVSRRIPVREQKEEAWETRVVDDKSESGINYATQPKET